MHTPHEFCDSCPGCRPALAEVADDGSLVPFHWSDPAAVETDRYWKRETTYAQRRAYINFTVNNSRDPRDMKLASQVAQRIAWILQKHRSPTAKPTPESEHLAFQKKLRRDMDDGLQSAIDRAHRTGERVKDMMFSLGGKEKPETFDEFNASGRIMTVALMRTTTPAAIPGCTVLKCDACGHDCWISPAAKEAYDRYERRQIRCMECMVEVVQEMEKHQ